MRKTAISMWVLGLSSSLVSVACKTDDGAGTNGGSGGGAGTGTGTGGLVSSGGMSSSDGGDGGSVAEGGSSGGGTGDPTRELLDCKSRDATSAKSVMGKISTDQTWSGTVYVKYGVAVEDGATLTIEPGTQVIMGAGAELRVGLSGTLSKLKAMGTAASPIRFCGEQGDAGFWQHIRIEKESTSDTELHHVLISDGGLTGQALWLASAIDVQNVQVRNSQTDGVRVEDFKAGSSGLSVEGVGGTAVVLDTPAAVEHFPVGGVFKNNKSNVLAINYAGISADVRFRNVGIPYYQPLSPIYVEGGKLTFDPGVVYRFGPDSGLIVGWAGKTATFTAVGTEAEPIVFEGATQEAGFWEGIWLQTSVTTDSVLSNVEIRHGGGSKVYALDVRAAVTLDGVTVSDGEAGVFIGASGLDKSSKNLTVTKGADRPLTVELDGLVTLPEGGSFTGNAIDEVAIKGGLYGATGTVPNLGIPYRFLSSMITTDGSSLTLTAGSEFIVSSGANLRIGEIHAESTLIAAGTAAKPIRIRGSEASSGYWAGLIVGDSVSSASKLDYVEISGGKDACATLLSSIPVTHSTFSQCTGYGILKQTTDTRDYETGNAFTAVGSGNVGTL